MTNITKEEADLFLTKFKKRGERTLSLLGKQQEFIKAMSSDIGQQILNDLIQEHELLLDKIASIKATDEEKMQYKVVRQMLMLWSNRLAAFTDLIKEIKTN